MSNLETYVRNRDAMNRLFKRPTMDPKNLSHVDLTELLDCVEGDLSPENLTCDGELPRSQVASRHKFLTAVKREIEARLVGA